MADRRVALLRGINVGRAKRISMAQLRAVFEDLGYGDVRTLLNSGNVVFDVRRATAGDVALRIEDEIARRLGVTTRVFVLPSKALARAVDENPLVRAGRDPARLLVLALAGTRARTQLMPLTRQSWAPEALALGPGVAYLWCPGGIAESPLGAAVSRAVGEAGTARNMTTMAKLRAIACAGDP